MGIVGLQGVARHTRKGRLGIALAGLVATFAVSQPAVAAAPSPASQLAHLRAEVRAAVNAQRHHKRVTHNAYEQIRELALKLEALLKKGPSACRKSLSAAQRLAGDLSNSGRLKADLRRAQSGLPKCPAVLLPTKPTNPTNPTDNPPVGILDAFTSTTNTSTVNTTGFSGTETDDTVMTSDPAPGADPAQCSGLTCLVPLEYNAANTTTDITASNNLPEPPGAAPPPCNYSNSFVNTFPGAAGQLELRYDSDGKLTSAQLQYQYPFAVGPAPTFSGNPVFLFTCISLGGSSPTITKPVDAATLSEGNQVNVSISDSGSANESGYYGDAGGFWDGGTLSGDLSYSNTTHLTFEIRGSR